MTGGVLHVPDIADTLVMTGQGRRADPYVLPPCTNLVGIFARLRFISRMERGCETSWRVLDWSVAPDLPGTIEKFRIIRREFTETQVLDTRLAFYFDVSAVRDAPSGQIQSEARPRASDSSGPAPTGAQAPKYTPTVWSDGGKIEFPHDFAWLHFDNCINNASPGEPLNVSLFYSGTMGKAVIYVYGSYLGNEEEALKQEAAKVISVAKDFFPDADSPWPPSQQGPLFGQYWRSGEVLTYAGVAARGGRFIKVRLTMEDQVEQCREMNKECLELIAAAIDGGVSSWRPVSEEN